MENQLRQVLSEVFEMEAGEFTADSNPENVALWDSLHHLKMITELEKVFEVRFTMKEVRSMTTFARVQGVLASHLDEKLNRQECGG